MRAKNIAKNSFFSVFSQVLIIVAGFFSQRVINLKLGTDLVGLNGVISNVIMVFSVSELGISTAIVFHLYQAFSNGDEKQIAALMNLYRRAYYAVAGIMLILGGSFLPFVHLLMKENPFSLGYVRLIYGLWLARSVLGYLLSYKRSIIIADQREYVSSLATMAVSIFNYVSVIVLVSLTGDYVLALSLGIAFEVVVNALLICYVNKEYPYLRQYGNLVIDGEEKKGVFRDVKNLFVTRIAQKLLGSTDNLIMSGFINLSIVGFYSNYCLITQSLINVMQALSNAFQPTVGNLVVEKNKKRDEELLQSFTFLFFLLSSVIMAGVSAMASLFVSDIWLGKDFLLSEGTVYWCALNCMLYILFLPIGTFVNACGLFRQEKWVAMTAAMVNLALSLLLVKPYGILGVMFGTTCAYGILFLGKAYFCYRLYFMAGLWRYLLQVSCYVLLGMGEAWFARRAALAVYGSGGNIGRFLLAAVCSATVPLAVNALLFCKSDLLSITMKLIRNYRKLS